jgi:hypothetical protein
MAAGLPQVAGNLGDIALQQVLQVFAQVHLPFHRDCCSVWRCLR